MKLGTRVEARSQGRLVGPLHDRKYLGCLRERSCNERDAGSSFEFRLRSRCCSPVLWFGRAEALGVTISQCAGRVLQKSAILARSCGDFAVRDLAAYHYRGMPAYDQAAKDYALNAVMFSSLCGRIIGKTQIPTVGRKGLSIWRQSRKQNMMQWYCSPVTGRNAPRACFRLADSQPRPRPLCLP
jgi:hypothetical protein